jgi:hypothetical protein
MRGLRHHRRRLLHRIEEATRNLDPRLREEIIPLSIQIAPCPGMQGNCVPHQAIPA